MRVQSTREIDVARLISELDTKANQKQEDKKIKGRFYEVVVNKQLLIDACDALRHYYNKEVTSAEEPTKTENDLK